MDEAFNNHRPHIKRKNRSMQHLNHLSLAPLSLRLPLSDPESLAALDQYEFSTDVPSGATTPSTISRRSSRPSVQKLSRSTFPKSKSSTFLMISKNSPSNSMTPRGTKSQLATPKDHSRSNSLSPKDGIDSDWLLRTGDVLASSARESKGQAWLVSRASSICMTKLKDDDDKESERDYTRERGRHSRRSSTRGSVFGGFEDDFCSVNNSTSSISPTSRDMSRPVTHLASRAMSRCGSKLRLLSSPTAVEQESYFDCNPSTYENQLGEESEFLGTDAIYDEETEQQDEDTIRKLARDYSQGLGGLVEKMLGWKLLADIGIGRPDNCSEADDNHENENFDEPHGSSLQNPNSSTCEVNVDVPPPEEGEISVWKDASWILSVAAKLIL